MTVWNSCEGVKPVTVGEHEALKGIPTDWPEVLGYNKESQNRRQRFRLL